MNRINYIEAKKHGEGDAMSRSHEKAVILIVDDEELMRDVCCMALKTEGYRVATAKDGFSGMAEAKQLDPDLVLVDLHMPGMSGFEVMERLNEICPRAIKSLITGNLSVDLEKEVVLKRRGWGYLKKPFTPAELRHHVQLALNSKTES